MGTAKKRMPPAENKSKAKSSSASSERHVPIAHSTRPVEYRQIANGFIKTQHQVQSNRGPYKPPIETFVHKIEEVVPVSPKKSK